MYNVVISNTREALEAHRRSRWAFAYIKDTPRCRASSRNTALKQGRIEASPTTGQIVNFLTIPDLVANRNAWVVHGYRSCDVDTLVYSYMSIVALDSIRDEPLSSMRIFPFLRISIPLTPISLSVFLLLVSALFPLQSVLATWNGLPYLPGQTLDPECVPTDVDCMVEATSTAVATTTFSGPGSHFDADTIDSLDSTYLLANAFSTTSATYWQGQQDFFSTSSATYFLSTVGTGGGGTVTSVGLTVPTGFSVSGGPVTGAGTFALSFAPGYALSLTASTTNWNGFYDDPSSRITAGTNLSWSGGTLNGPSDSYMRSLISVNGPIPYDSSSGIFTFSTSTISGSGSHLDADTLDGLDSTALIATSFSTTSALYWKSQNNFFSTTSALYWKTQNDFFSTTSASYFLAQNIGLSVAGIIAGTTTDALPQGTTQKYYADSLARAALSAGTGISYDSSSGIITNTGITSTAGDWSGTFNGQAGSWYVANSFSTTSAAYWKSQQGFFSSTNVTGLSYSGGVLSAAAGYSIPLTASTTNWDSFYQTPSSRIVAGTGLAWTGNTLSVTGGSGVGTVTSVDVSGGNTGLSFTGGPITSSGSVTLSGILNVPNGGTGWGAVQSGALLYGNGTNALATTSAGTAGHVLALLNGIPTWTATTTAGTGLTYSSGSFSVNTTQNITRLSNLSSAGFVKTDASGNLSIDSSTYLTGNQTITLSGDVSGSGATTISLAIGANKVTNTMLAGSIAGSKLVGTDITSLANLATIGTVVSGTWQGGTVAVAYGGTGQTSFTAGRLIYGTGSTALANVATTSASAGSGISVSGGGALVGGSGLTITNTGVISVSCTTITCSGTSPATFSIGNGAIANAQLANSSITVTAGTGLSGGGTVALGGSTSVSLATPVSIANGGTGVTSLSGGWIYSDGNSLSASSSPSVNWITATSTTVASTFGYRVGIGVSPTTPLDVNGDITDRGLLNCQNLTKAVVTDTNGKLQCGTLSLSDQRLKTNITNLDDSDGLALINALTPVSYNWKDPNVYGGTDALQYGFIAQQAQTVAPNLVGTTTATALTPGYSYFFNYFGVIAPLVKAVQELDQKIAAGAFDSITTKHIQTNELCVDDVCVTKEQFLHMVQNSQQSGYVPAVSPVVTPSLASVTDTDATTTTSTTTDETADDTPSIPDTDASTTESE